MNTRDLQAFVAVVESGSIVGAAERLHLTQPGLTRRIQSLESVLDLALLDRQAKPLKPTAAGREVYRLARNVLGAVDELLAVASPDSEPGGELRIGVPPFLSDLALEQPLDRLRSAFAKLTLRITAGWSPGLLQSVERAEIDAAVVLMPGDSALPEALERSRLAFMPTTVVAARALGLPADPVMLEDLAQHSWVLNQDGCGMRSALSRALTRAGLPFTVAVEAFGSDLQLSLVARQIGIGIVSPEVLARSPFHDALQTVEVADFEAGVDAWLVHHALPGRLVRPVALLRDSLVEVLTANGLTGGAQHGAQNAAPQSSYDRAVPHKARRNGPPQ
ncbi:LysR family transcriptional regulator [Paraburkholderia ferrariae]|uniref:LysR family transcriptional regulator n=1 Tax=Paraburkholderia ferrariae TaxID=386056 RepID=UPI0005A7941C|nr:LysR family transcriptional regulator [Paraburkholderia ferrariae]